MRFLSGPSIAFVLTFCIFAQLANEQATLNQLEREELILDQRIFSVMRVTFQKLHAKKQLSGLLRQEYEAYCR